MMTTHRNSSRKPDALDAVLDHIAGAEDYEGLRSINEIVLNALMKKERDIFLKSAGTDNKANGFYPRALASGLGNIALSIPRDRQAEFRPFLLPDNWQRGDQSVDDLMSSLLLQAYSPNKIKAIFKKLGLPYSQDDLDALQEELYQRSLEFKARELDQEVFALFIDAYHTQIKETDGKKVKKAVIYTVLGIAMDGKKEVFGYYDDMGGESKTFWLQVLNDLISRGLKKPLLIVSDDFQGLDNAIAALYPKTDHQLCFVHLLRNVKRNLGKADARDLIDALKLFKTHPDPERALTEFNTLCDAYDKKYPDFIRRLRSKADHFLAFLRYPRGIRKFIYTTNAVENVNSRLEVLRVNLGGYFQSQRTLNIAVQVLVDKIHRDRWKKPVPAFLEHQYEIRQLFAQKFAA
jgi:putative transposase